MNTNTYMNRRESIFKKACQRKTFFYKVTMGGADSFLLACSSLPIVSALLWFPDLNYVLFSSKIKPYFNHSSLLAQNSQKKSTFIYRDTMPKLTQSKPYAQGSISLLGSHKNNHLIHFLKDFEKLVCSLHLFCGCTQRGFRIYSANLDQVRRI